MKKYLTENKEFLIPYLVFLSLFLPILIIFQKSEIHLAINKFHSAFFDQFFKVFTNLGDGLAPVILGVVLSLFSFRKGLMTIFSGVFAGIVAQFFKRVVFHDIARPAKFFENMADLHFVDGVDIHHSFSFPSGHAATAFALCLSLAFFAGSGKVKALLFFLALLIAFSRVYLSQHFLNDIYAGSIIGVFSAFVFLYLFGNSEKKWMDNSLINLIRRRQI